MQSKQYFTKIKNYPHEKSTEPGKLIEEELHRQERSVTWFANKLYCDRTNTYKIFKRQSIDTELLLRISQVLHVNFFEYYSRECQNREKQSTLM